jgi:hypothetical protein
MGSVGQIDWDRSTYAANHLRGSREICWIRIVIGSRGDVGGRHCNHVLGDVVGKICKVQDFAPARIRADVT